MDKVIYTEKEKNFMLEAIRVAESSGTRAYPNPRVGCVIVHENTIISKASTEIYGGKHAEVLAIEKLKRGLKNLSMYVTLEPCSHVGKTKACTSIIDRERFNKIIIASKDPNPKACGGGKILEKKNIIVKYGLLDIEAKKINRRFFTFYNKLRPYVILKYASTLDGYIAKSDYKSKWITNKKSRVSSHELRATCDAILVGRNTIKYDNPSLSSHGKGKNPKVIIIGQKSNMKNDKKVFDTKPILISKDDFMPSNKTIIENILDKMYALKFQTVLVEGGGATITSFAESGLFDEIHAYIAPKFLGKGIKVFSGEGTLDNKYNLKIIEIENIDNDLKIVYQKD